MNSAESMKLLLAASGGDSVKLFDLSLEPSNPCLLKYTPSPGLRVNTVKWNHNNLVLASAGEDDKISLWKKNGQSLWTLPTKTSRGEMVEPSESISAINFTNKGSRYLCSGGSGQVVRIWDLQNKRCIKWLKGHTDTITGVVCNCKDEHVASVSRKGDLIIHNLATGTRDAEHRDPNGQVLSAVDYSRTSRHLLVTAGDDGSIHLWDATARSPKVSWLKQHTAPISGVSFSPSNDKFIASVGLDMKLYTFESGSRKPTSWISYEAPFSSLVVADDGLTLAAGTSTGHVVFYDIRGKPQPITVLHAYGNTEAVVNLCWQRSRSLNVTESNCTDDNVLLAGDTGDSILMPDPLPSKAPALFPEETPQKTSLLNDVTLKRLHPRQSYNLKDDMKVFSPLAEVQPITPSLYNMLDADAPKKDDSKKPSFSLSSWRSGQPEDGTNNNHSIMDWNKQGDSPAFSHSSNAPPSATGSDSSSITPPEAWGGDRLSEKEIHYRPTTSKSSRFAALTANITSLGALSSGKQGSLPTDQSTTNSVLSLPRFHNQEIPSIGVSMGPSESVSLTFGTKSIASHTNVGNLGPDVSLPRRFSSYAQRIGASISDAPSFGTASPKSKKNGAEARGEILSGLLCRSDMAIGTAGFPSCDNDGGADFQRGSLQSDTHTSSFTLQLFQRSLEESLASFQKSIHEDMRNLHVDTLRQFHMQEAEMSSAMEMILENQAEIMKELQSLRREMQQLHQSL